MMATFIIAGVTMTTWLVWTNGPLAVFRAIRSELFRFVAPSLVGATSELERNLLTVRVPLGVFFACGTCYILFLADYFHF
jgi:hypothetical protein